MICVAKLVKIDGSVLVLDSGAGEGGGDSGGGDSDEGGGHGRS